ncbi:hypothetical protein [Peribacillus sp. SCS-37]|uniref:hypothetical protein n=1 Tax=Paraperibacillus esterisolvens TaxID=3115296 RepID=UPI003906BE4C
MKNHVHSLAIVFLGICIVVGSWFISKSFENNQQNHYIQPSVSEEFEYELISVNDTNIIIFDKRTGQYWRKYIELNEGPTDWREEESPIK